MSPVRDMFGRPLHIDSYLNPLAEPVYAVTFFGTGLAIARSDDGRDPCVHFNHSEVIEMISVGRMMAAIGLIVVVTGCFEHTYILGAGAPAGPVVYDE